MNVYMYFCGLFLADPMMHNIHTHTLTHAYTRTTYFIIHIPVSTYNTLAVFALDRIFLACASIVNQKITLPGTHSQLRAHFRPKGSESEK